jgi:hypothetical protein
MGSARVVLVPLTRAHAQVMLRWADGALILVGSGCDVDMSQPEGQRLLRTGETKCDEKGDKGSPN